MKRCAVVFLMVIISFLILSVSAAADVKIGVVDFDVLQERSAEFQKVREMLQQKAEELKAKLTKESNALAKLEEEYQKQSMMLSLDAQESKRKELERKRRHYNYIFEEYNRELRETEADAMRTMSRQVRAVLEDLGAARGFTVIFDKEAPGLLYGGGAVDVTDEVVKALDR